MNRRDAHRFDRLHQVRQVEEQRARQDLVAAHSLLRNASAERDAARRAAGQLPGIGVRDLGLFRTELAVGQLRNEQLAAADELVRQAEAAVLQAHTTWTQAARRVQGLDKLVERRREAARAEELVAESSELEDLFLARLLMAKS
jgi:flagellar export protein FliJ